jgi:hypothetical protein
MLALKIFGTAKWWYKWCCNIEINFYQQRSRLQHRLMCSCLVTTS